MTSGGVILNCETMATASLRLPSSTSSTRALNANETSRVEFSDQCAILSRQSDVVVWSLPSLSRPYHTKECSGCAIPISAGAQVRVHSACPLKGKGKWAVFFDTGQHLCLRFGSDAESDQVIVTEQYRAINGTRLTGSPCGRYVGVEFQGVDGVAHAVVVSVDGRNVCSSASGPTGSSSRALRFIQMPLPPKATLAAMVGFGGEETFVLGMGDDAGNGISIGSAVADDVSISLHSSPDGEVRALVRGGGCLWSQRMGGSVVDVSLSPDEATVSVLLRSEKKASESEVRMLVLIVSSPQTPCWCLTTPRNTRPHHPPSIPSLLACTRPPCAA